MTFQLSELNTWRSGVRSDMHAASQLPGRGPLMWVMLLHLHLNQSLMMMMMMMMMVIDDYDNVDDEEPLWCSG